MKLIDLRAIESSLAKLLNATLEIKVAYRMIKFSKVVQIELKELEEMRMKLLDKYAKKENGKFVTVNIDGGEQILLENPDAFKSEWESLLQEDVVLPDVKLTIANIEEANEKGAKITPLDLVNLEFLLEEPEDGK